MAAKRHGPRGACSRRARGVRAADAAGTSIFLGRLQLELVNRSGRYIEAEIDEHITARGSNLPIHRFYLRGRRLAQRSKRPTKALRLPGLLHVFPSSPPWKACTRVTAGTASAGARSGG